MKTIWKYTMNGHKAVFHMPEGAEFLDLQVQHGNPTMWFVVDDTKPLEDRTFQFFGTGHELPENILEDFMFCGTFQIESFVFHTFEEITWGK